MCRQRAHRTAGSPADPPDWSSPLTCSDTCRVRRHRGADLVYLESWLAAQAGARRFVHEAHRDLVATTRAVAASRRERRDQRRGLPKVQPMKVQTAARAS
jgi:hypothetical protein